MRDRLKYFGLEPAAFTGDADFVTMTTEQRGAYVSVILYLYQSNGKLLCSSNGTAIAQLCGFNQNWPEIWGGIRHKFILKDGYISHKRVNKEIERAEKFRKTKSEAGKKGASKRWHSHSTAIAEPKLCHNNDTLREDTIVNTQSPSEKGADVFTDTEKHEKKDIKRFPYWGKPDICWTCGGSHPIGKSAEWNALYCGEVFCKQNSIFKDPPKGKAISTGEIL